MKNIRKYMQSFTKYKDVVVPEENGKVVYDGYVKVLNYKDWEIVDDVDMVVCIPYLVDEGCILLRSEYIPTYQLKNKDDRSMKNVTNYITCISGSVERNENPVDAMRRELQEEAGVVLSTFKELEVDKSLHISKGNLNKYHIFFLELRYNEYRLIQAKSDGSEAEDKSKTFRLDLGYLNDIKTNDLITDYLLQEVKNNYDL